MKPEQSKNVLASFFEALRANVDRIDTSRMESSPNFTDIQLKQLFIAGDPTAKYALNFALITENERTRAEIFALLKMLIENSIGHTSKEQGYRNTEKRIRLYKGDQPVLLGD